MPLAYVNQYGGNDDLVFDGRSCAFNGAGAPIARGKGFEADVVICDLAAPPIAPAAELAAESEVWRALVLGTRDYARKCGFKGALLGLSGGIDSALTAAIAAEAFGADHVLGVLMRAALGDKNIDFVAVNDLTSAHTLAHLLKYDSVLGNLHGAVFARHLLPGRFAEMDAERDLAVLLGRREQDTPAVFRHPDVVELGPALGIDRHGRAQIDQRLLEALGPHA